MSVYVYGVTRAGHPALSQRMEGVGDPPRPVRTLRQGGLAALVSDCPPGLRPERHHLMAHQHVLTRAGGMEVVLPLRFGSVSRDEGTVRRALAEYADHYLAQLDELDGRVEYNVRAAHRQEAVLHQVLVEEPEVQALSAANQAAGGGTYQDRVRLGEMIAEAVRAREERDAALVEHALIPCAERHCPGPDSRPALLNLCFLLPRKDSGGLHATVRTLQGRHPQLDFQMSGPLPPYSFVTSPAASQHAKS